MGSLHGFKWGGKRRLCGLSGSSTIANWREDGRRSARDMALDAMDDSSYEKLSVKAAVAKALKIGRADYADQQKEAADDAAERARAEGEKVTAKQLTDAFWEAWADEAESQLERHRAELAKEED